MFEDIEGFEDIDKIGERARRALALAEEETRRLDHHYVGTEHVLLGLIREGEDVAAQVLGRFGADVHRVRELVRHESA